ncbi:MAG: ABC transporter permease [Clostridia bacterium]|nr:ABC transporter permease [Clostridia bacterium]
MKRKSRFSFLLLAGILLLAAGLIGLSTVPNLIQYAFLPTDAAYAVDTSFTDYSSDGTDYPTDDMDVPEDSAATASQTPKEDRSTPLLDRFDESVYKGMGEMFPKLTLHSMKTDVALSMVNKRNVGSITVYAVGPFWNEIYTPDVIKGRPIDRIDAEKKAKVIVLDEETAFNLFIDKDPLGQTVTMEDGTELEVVGVAKHSRRVGETGEHAAWVPLDLIANGQMLVLSTQSDSVDMFSMFKTQAESYYPGGTAISMVKEKNRALLPLLLVFVIIAIWLLKRWIGWMAGFGKIRWEMVRAESKRRYVMKLIPYAAGQLLPVALLIVLTIAACFGVAVVAITPIRIFPEWVPETLGEYTSWINRFWSLATVSANPVTLKTPELAEVQLWSDLILWGTFLILLRAAKQTLTGFLRKKEED